MSELKMFSNNDCELIIANSAEDAVTIWNKTTGDDYVKDNYGTLDDWQPCEDDKLIAIGSPDEKYEWLTSDDAHLPKDAVITDGAHYPTITTFAKYWVEFIGKPCYFAGDE